MSNAPGVEYPTDQIDIIIKEVISRLEENYDLVKKPSMYFSLKKQNKILKEIYETELISKIVDKLKQEFTIKPKSLHEREVDKITRNRTLILNIIDSVADWNKDYNTIDSLLKDLDNKYTITLK